MGLRRHVMSNDARASPSLDSMGTYAADNPPQDEPGKDNNPRDKSLQMLIWLLSVQKLSLLNSDEIAVADNS